MRPETIAIAAIFLGFALAEFVRTNLFHKVRQRRKDGVVEVISTATLVMLTQPLVLLAGGLLAAAIAPDARDSLGGIPLVAQVALFLVPDRVGVENLPPVSAQHQLLWPLVRDR
ncbi:MAG: hypothetical protein O2907_00880 [Proteobacteria bacterium]|nr:hypothetical protein [Pseudomonadota bacterium]MDA1062884.1 hypothetical protein [Pseudomonadota bacterium]